MHEGTDRVGQLLIEACVVGITNELLDLGRQILRVLDRIKILGECPFYGLHQLLAERVLDFLATSRPLRFEIGPVVLIFGSLLHQPVDILVHYFTDLALC